MAAHEHVEQTALNVPGISRKETAIFIESLTHLLQECGQESGLKLFGGTLQAVASHIIVNLSTQLPLNGLKKSGSWRSRLRGEHSFLPIQKLMKAMTGEKQSKQAVR
jgi:hypothetical protein